MSFSSLLGNIDRVTVDQLGDAVTYNPTVGDSVECSGIFDAVYVRVDTGQAGVSTSGPAVFLLLADIEPNDPETDSTATITYDGSDYEIREIEKDGKGGARLLLWKL